MKHLLTGVAIVAVTALAIPAFAQPAPMTPQTAPQTVPMTPSTSAAKPMRQMVMHHHYRGVGEGEGADQLNQQLQRIQSGEAAPLTPASMPMPMPSNYQTPGKPDAPTAPAPVPPSNYQTPGR
jgi:hypothetical protein